MALDCLVRPLYQLGQLRRPYHHPVHNHVSKTEFLHSGSVYSFLVIKEILRNSFTDHTGVSFQGSLGLDYFTGAKILFLRVEKEAQFHYFRLAHSNTHRLNLLILLQLHHMFHSISPLLTHQLTNNFLPLPHHLHTDQLIPHTLKNYCSNMLWWYVQRTYWLILVCAFGRGKDF